MYDNFVKKYPNITLSVPAAPTTAASIVIVPVRLCLAALPGQRLEDIERVYSHIQALGQAEAFLRDDLEVIASNVPKRDIIELDMSVGEGMKMVISGGAVAPPFPPVTPADNRNNGGGQA